MTARYAGPLPVAVAATHGGDGRAHQPGHLGVGQPLGPAGKFVRAQPLVPFSHEALNQRLVRGAHLGVIDGDREVRLALGDGKQGERAVLDHGRADRRAQLGGVDVDPCLLAHLTGGRLGQGLAALRAAADREPEAIAAAVQFPAELQQHAPSRSTGRTRAVLRLTLSTYSTIFEIGISRMSCAPAAFSAGISVLTPRLGTTVSTAFMPPLASWVIVGEDIAGSIELTAASLSAGTLSLSSTWPRARIAPWSSSAMSSIAAFFSGSSYEAL